MPCLSTIPIPGLTEPRTMLYHPAQRLVSFKNRVNDNPVRECMFSVHISLAVLTVLDTATVPYSIPASSHSPLSRIACERKSTAPPRSVQNSNFHAQLLGPCNVFVPQNTQKFASVSSRFLSAS